MRVCAQLKKQKLEFKFSINEKLLRLVLVIKNMGFVGYAFLFIHRVHVNLERETYREKEGERFSKFTWNL